MKELSKNGAKPSGRVRSSSQNVRHGAPSDGGELPQNAELPSVKELADYRQATRLLADSRIKKPVSRVVKEYLQLAESLQGLPVAEASKLITDRRRLVIPISVAELVDAYLYQHGPEDYPGARVHLRHFLTQFEGPLSLVTPRAIQVWIDDLAEVVTEDTLRAHLGSVTALFCWARRRRYWPYNEPLPTESVRAGEHFPKGREDLVTPADFQTLLTASAALSARNGEVGVKLTLFLALSGLAGLRDQELRRLTWSNIDAPAQEITVVCHSRRAERCVRYGTALRQWISRQAEWDNQREGGLIFGPDADALSREILRLADRLQIFWPVNALRNSWIAYRAALPGDEVELAAAAGVPLAAWRRHFGNLADPGDAAVWFAIAPDWCVGE